MTKGEQELHEQVQELRLHVWRQEDALHRLHTELGQQREDTYRVTAELHDRDEQARRRDQHLADQVDQLVQVLVDTLEDDEQPLFWESLQNLGIAETYAMILALRA